MMILLLRKTDVVNILNDIVKTIEDNRQYLTDLDAAIGDADHGINLDRGFKAVRDKMTQFSDKDIGTILKNVGMVLVSTVGGASGPLYGTFFMRMGNVVSGKNTLDENDIVAMFEAGLSGIKERGKAQVGDKTMIDSMEPALNELKKALSEGRGLKEAIEAAANNAYNGVLMTKDIAAKKGRASYLGERSIGHQDPGATSAYLMIKTVADYVDKLQQ
ncbi:dihydroxyacetone kinase, L subunit [Thermoanaerobacterium xylanolyticum LX-11]|uniref:phosphoenolpyruvate--glycerone phosphotransferase n=1 Tax=Thermoanaerobacterium xylanolyticum (strain ATCC 49914 / DSM 7097 / LX-11) TaxID=858215 RepID=F6BHF8_THEXL|nr:dihydroxyacetone kinase subunit DhaL [Thermoanaerobacterium xylanolyticum]AEF16539.1 dihydroxyacetone kinase, L subunit [Thermoanaerobacterium xylanolyticum LX-11]